MAHINVYDPIYELSSHGLFILRFICWFCVLGSHSELKYVPKAFSYAMASLGGKSMYSFPWG